MLAGTDELQRRIWLTSPNNSCLGKFSVSRYERNVISCAFSHTFNSRKSFIWRSVLWPIAICQLRFAICPICQLLFANCANCQLLIAPQRRNFPQALHRLRHAAGDVIDLRLGVEAADPEADPSSRGSLAHPHPFQHLTTLPLALLALLPPINNHSLLTSA